MRWRGHSGHAPQTPPADDAGFLRAQMLAEMARTSLDDGLFMQIHPGWFRNHNRRLDEDDAQSIAADLAYHLPKREYKL